MRNISSLKNSAFITRADISQPTLVTIDRIVEERVGQEKELKTILHFEELQKGLVLNYTNAETIADILGTPDMDEWGGGRIVLYDDPTIMYAGKRVGGIRVRAPKQVRLTAPEPELVNDIPF